MAVPTCGCSPLIRAETKKVTLCDLVPSPGGPAANSIFSILSSGPMSDGAKPQFALARVGAQQSVINGNTSQEKCQRRRSTAPPEFKMCVRAFVSTNTHFFSIRAACVDNKFTEGYMEVVPRGRIPLLIKSTRSSSARSASIKIPARRPNGDQKFKWCVNNKK